MKLIHTSHFFTFWQPYFTAQKAVQGSCQKKSAVWWLAGWEKQNTVSSMPKCSFFEPHKWRMTHLEKAVARWGWCLHQKPSSTAMTKATASFSAGMVHALMSYTWERQKANKTAPEWWWECSCSPHQGNATYCSQISPCPWLRNSQTLGISVGSSGKAQLQPKPQVPRSYLYDCLLLKVTHCNSVCGPPSFPVQHDTELSLQR